MVFPTIKWCGKKYNPDANGYFPKFIDKAVSYAPLKMGYYIADHHTVYQAQVSFTKGHPLEDWIKADLRCRGGSRSLKALSNHFTGHF